MKQFLKQGSTHKKFKQLVLLLLSQNLHCQCYVQFQHLLWFQHQFNLCEIVLQYHQHPIQMCLNYCCKYIGKTSTLRNKLQRNCDLTDYHTQRYILMARFLIHDQSYFILFLQSLPRKVQSYDEDFLVRKLQIFQMVNLLARVLNQLVECK